MTFQTFISELQLFNPFRQETLSDARNEVLAYLSYQGMPHYFVVDLEQVWYAYERLSYKNKGGGLLFNIEMEGGLGRFLQTLEDEIEDI